MRNRWGRRANRVSQYRRQRQGVERQGQDAGEGGKDHRTGGEFFVVVELDGKHRSDGRARAGFEQQYDGGHGAVQAQQADKLFENQQLLRQPIVRNGRQATAGYCPEVWEKWE